MAYVTVTERVPNFALKKVWRCMNCGSEIIDAKDLYSRRFCSIECKQEFLKE